LTINISDKNNENDKIKIFGSVSAHKINILNVSNSNEYIKYISNYCSKNPAI